MKRIGKKKIVKETDQETIIDTLTKGKSAAVPPLALGDKLRKEIYEALQGPVVDQLLREAGIAEGGSYWRSVMEGHSLKVEQRLLPHLCELFEEVKAKLCFEEKVDFYITGASDVNAFSVAAEKTGDPHIVNVNSALLELMTDDELRFVLGHELGHLIDRDTSLLQLIGFVFPDETAMPIVLQHKVRLWQQLAELMADRYGYLAADDLGACVSAFYKMASGLDITKMNVKLDELLDENLRHLDYFLKDDGISAETHPVNPIRVQSLNLFANCKDENQLEKDMAELIEILLKVGDGKTGRPLSIFLATAGLFAATADGDMNDKEYEVILQHVAETQMFPREFIDQIVKQDLNELFAKSVQDLLEEAPSLREGMFGYMIGLVLADDKITMEEMDFLYEIGEKVFGYCRKETALMTAQMMQQDFIPATDTLCQIRREE